MNFIEEKINFIFPINQSFLNNLIFISYLRLIITIRYPIKLKKFISNVRYHLSYMFC